MSCGEVSDAQDVRVTLKSDVFAFAVTMWEMATRMHPWHGLGILAVRCTAETKAGLRCPSDYQCYVFRGKHRWTMRKP